VLGGPPNGMRRLQKGAKLLDGKAGISDDSGHGERVNWIVARYRYEASSV